MEVIAEIIFTLLGEIVFQAFIELLFELGIGSVRSTPKSTKATHPFIAGLGFSILGAIVGLIMSWAFPERIVPGIDLHGFSIVIAALGTGTVMMFYGRWRIASGKRTTYLATFWGGSLFAFFMALTRWMLVVK